MSRTVPAKSINLNDFDFTVDKTRMTIAEPHDGSVTIRLPGKNRKTANHELLFIPYFKKHRLKFKTAAIGKHTTKGQAPIVVFDQHTLGQENATIRKYGETGGFINSKGHALKILDIFDIEVPSAPDQVVKLYFKLHPTSVSRNTLNYRICIISLMKVVKNEAKKEPAHVRRIKKKKKLPKRQKTKNAQEKEKTTTPNIL